MDVRQTTATSSGERELAQSLISRAEKHDGRPPVSDQAMIEAVQGKRELSLFTEAQDPATPVAVGIVGGGELDLVVDPQARGRGIGTAVLAALMDPAAPLRGTDPEGGIGTYDAQRDALPQASWSAQDDGVGGLRAWAHGENPAADALLARAGFAPVRTLYLMELDPALLPAVDPATDAQDDVKTGTPPRHPAAAAGGSQDLTLRTFTEADAEDWVRVNAAAFAEHPEQGRITSADFAAMRGEPWFDADDLILLEGPDGVVGSTWIKTVRGPEAETELYAIGVDPAHAGKGLGKLLLAATLERMAQHSPARVTLYVDGDNEPAVALYRAAGFAVASTSRQWSNAAVHRPHDG